MTRETAINNIPDTFKMMKAYELEDTVGAMQAIINTIYDDFESHTCSSCRHYTDVGECKAMDIGANTSINGIDTTPVEVSEWITIPEDFGCNKWRQKD